MPTPPLDLCQHGRNAKECYYEGECWAERTAKAFADLAQALKDQRIQARLEKLKNDRSK